MMNQRIIITEIHGEIEVKRFLRDNKNNWNEVEVGPEMEVRDLFNRAVHNRRIKAKELKKQKHKDKTK